MNSAMGVHEFDTFLSILRLQDNLAFQLSGKGPYTVFAPTNDAFNKLGPAAVDNLKNNEVRRKQFLLNHIVRGKFTAQEIVNKKSLRTLGGKMLHMSKSGGVGTVNGARFSIPNVTASNGILQGMDRVLVQ